MMGGRPSDKTVPGLPVIGNLDLEEKSMFLTIDSVAFPREEITVSAVFVVIFWFTSFGVLNRIDYRISHYFISAKSIPEPLELSYYEKD